MSEGEDWKDVLRLIRGIMQDRTINEMEGVLAETPSFYLPMPNTVHPAYQHYSYMAEKFKDRIAIRIPRGVKVNWVSVTDSPYPSEPLPKPHLLERKNYYGPAPFVGNPLTQKAAYFWYAWEDEAGRWIAGDAELRWGYRV